MSASLYGQQGHGCDIWWHDHDCKDVCFPFHKAGNLRNATVVYVLNMDLEKKLKAAPQTLTFDACVVLDDSLL